MNAPQDFRTMTADSIGKDLLSALVTEVKLMPDTWPKLSQKRQDDIIDRLRKRVESSVSMAVHLLAAQGRVTVCGDLDQITIKDGVKAVVKFSPAAASLHQLYEAAGKAVLVIVAAAEDHTAGMDEIAGEADQRAMDLGHEYREDDGGGMDGNVIDAEFGLPAPGDVVTSQELEEAEQDGYEAAADGKPESDCPVMKGALCIAWVKGWKEWHERNAAQEEVAPEEPTTRYRHPDNANQTWTGRGRKPTWVVEWLENGGSMDDLLSDEE